MKWKRVGDSRRFGGGRPLHIIPDCWNITSVSCGVTPVLRANSIITARCTAVKLMRGGWNTATAVVIYNMEYRRLQ